MLLKLCKTRGSTNSKSLHSVLCWLNPGEIITMTQTALLVSNQLIFNTHYPRPSPSHKVGVMCDQFVCVSNSTSCLQSVWTIRGALSNFLSLIFVPSSFAVFPNPELFFRQWNYCILTQWTEQNALLLHLLTNGLPKTSFTLGPSSKL